MGTNKASTLCNLGAALSTRFDHTGLRNDLNEAIAAMEDALMLSPQQDDWILNNLGGTLLKRYQYITAKDDLTAGIAKANNKLSSIDWQTKCLLMQNLNAGLIKLFERNGCIDDLNEAIQLLTSMANLIPVGHQCPPGLLNLLGKALLDRFESMRSIDNLNAAVKALQEAIKSAPIYHPDRWAAMMNIGVAFLERFHHTGKLDDLNQSIKAQEDVLNMILKGYPNRPAVLHNLSNALQIRSRELKVMDGLDEAIKWNTESVELISAGPNNLNRALCLDALASALQRRFLENGLIEDINNSVTIAEEAVVLTAEIHPDHPDLARRLNNFGNTLRLRYERLKSKEDKESGIEVYEKASFMLIAPPIIRIQAALFGSRLLIGHNSRRAYSLLRMAIELLPATTSRHMPLADRVSLYYNIQKYPL